ncbi:MAG: hypothetical protein ABF380_04140, partial [Akkermansiaceae bacterium]
FVLFALWICDFSGWPYQKSSSDFNLANPAKSLFQFTRKPPVLNSQYWRATIIRNGFGAP